MVTECSYCGILDLEETSFFQDVFTLLQVIVPAAICFTLWRIFVTNRAGPRGGVVVLGLDDSSAIYSDPGRSGISAYVTILYCATSIFTFVVGLATSELWKLLSEAIAKL